MLPPPPPPRYRRAAAAATGANKDDGAAAGGGVIVAAVAAAARRRWHRRQLGGGVGTAELGHGRHHPAQAGATFDGALFNQGGNDSANVTYSVSADMSSLSIGLGAANSFNTSGRTQDNKANNGFQIEYIAVDPNPSGLTSFTYPVDLFAAVQDTLGAVARIADGDLSARIEVQRGDEIGQLQAAMQGMSSNLREMVGRLQGGVLQISASAQSLSASTEQTRQGVNGQPVRRAIRLNSYPMVLQAAEAGRGVALGWSYITDQILAEGRLVCPIDQALETSDGYYVSTSARTSHGAAISAFLEWIMAEAQGASDNRMHSGNANHSE